MKKSILSITMTAAIPLAALSLAACGGSQTASTADYIGINPVYVALRHTCTDSYSSKWEVRNLKVV